MERSPTFLAGRIHVPTSMYSLPTYQSSGQIEPAGHGFGPVADEALAVVERVLAGSEPMSGRDREYVIDEATGLRVGSDPTGRLGPSAGPARRR